MLSSISIQLLVCALFVNHVHMLDNGLARTPPMGWLAWQRFRCNIDCVNYPFECISEKLFFEQSALMVSEGYLAAGYNFISLDDCWMNKQRGPNGKLRADPKRFPNGIKVLSDYIHSLGLRFGIYESYGNTTCENYPGTTLKTMPLDAETFAEWGVDYVKLDGCHVAPALLNLGYPHFGYLLNATGRPMVYSCSWPAYEQFAGIQVNLAAIGETCNLWRIWGDINDSWASVSSIIDFMAKNQDRLIPFAGPGRWNDPDMLVIGNFGLSYDQSKAQMAIWSILAAPLIMSVDLRTIKSEYKAILQNREVIAIDQDPLGIQGRRLNITQEAKNLEVWVKPVLPMNHGKLSAAVVFFNRRDDGVRRKISAFLSDLGLDSPSGYKVHDLFEGFNLGTYFPGDKLAVNVNPTGVVMVKFTVQH